MNKRIEELADELGVTAITTNGIIGVVDGCFIVSPNNLEKFAELIVKECLNCMKNSEGDLDFAMWKIRKDFGVEE